MCAQGVKLYFRVLEGMLKAEQDRTGRSNFASLLASSSFHKCLAACAFEVVIASYRMVRLPRCRCSKKIQSSNGQPKPSDGAPSVLAARGFQRLLCGRRHRRLPFVNKSQVQLQRYK